MYKINDYVVYKREVCKIIDVNKSYYKGLDYYVLSVLNDETLKLQVPVDNNSIRPLMSKKDITNLIKKIPDIEIISCNDKLLEIEYKNKMKSENVEDLISIIKTTYLRNKKRLDNKKKTALKDNDFFEIAEKYLYTEIAVVFKISYNEAKEYVIGEVSKLGEIDKNDC